MTNEHASPVDPPEPGLIDVPEPPAPVEVPEPPVIVDLPEDA
jgi:hypothetical protein